MKKFTKITIIIAVIFAGIGIFCLIAALVQGVTWGTFTNMVQKGKFSIGNNGIVLEHGIDDEEERVEIFDNIKELEVEVDAGTFEIEYDDEVPSVQIKRESASNVTYYVEENTLHIKWERKWGIHNVAGKVILVIPQGMRFQEVDLEIGAGEANIDGLVTDSLDVSVGAGEAVIKKLDVRTMSAETGAGELVVQLLGKEEDYSYELECGIGSIEIGGQSYSGLGNKKTIRNENAIGELEIECGVGEVKVEFTK